MRVYGSHDMDEVGLEGRGLPVDRGRLDFAVEAFSRMRGARN